MKPFVLELTDIDPIAAFSAVHHLPYSLFLDSADRAHEAGRYSFIACYPVEAIEYKNGAASITNAHEMVRINSDPFRIIQNRLKDWGLENETLPHLPPFQGGAAGFFGYDLGRALETLPEIAADNPAMPDMAIGIYDQVLSFDHQTGQCWIITHAADEAAAVEKRNFLLGVLRRGNSARTASPAASEPRWSASCDKNAYMDIVRKTVNYIRAGDIFQANLSQRFDADLPRGFCSWSHYRHLRAVNPAPFSGYMSLGPVRISSASPERFVKLSGQKAETRPIKGTRPRTDEPALDQLYRNALQNSAKDKAENTMIVDLLRSDLSRVCIPDSVRVDALCRLESFARVHHLVSVVQGVLRTGRNAFDLLRACFPGGSITGAPKIRAMEIIEELETTRRGPYCGAMGYIGHDGAMDTNILIRTLVFENDHVSFAAGGGITASSDPAAEYQETLDKAEGMFRSFQGPHHTQSEESGAKAA